MKERKTLLLNKRNDYNHNAQISSMPTKYCKLRHGAC